jgi:hypothetical protein
MTDSTEKIEEAGTDSAARPKPPSDEEANTASPGFFKRSLHEPMTVITALILLVNLAYVVVSSGQLRALYQSNEGSQRAWLLPVGTTSMAREVNGECPIVTTAEQCCPGLPPPGQGYVLAPDLSYCVMVMIENTGVSPATDLRVAATWSLYPSKQTNEFFAKEFSDGETLGRASRGIVGGKHKTWVPIFHIGVHGNRRGFNGEETEAIQKRDGQLFLYGRLRYFNGFRERSTTFCYAYTPRGFDLCQGHNTAI